MAVMSISMANLGKLKSVNLNDNQITDISAFKKMSNAFALSLSGNCASDISMLPKTITVDLGDQKPAGHCTAADFPPDAFSFTAKTGVVASTVVESNPIIVGGINVPAVISITGGEYRINGEAYTKVAGGSVNKGDKVQVRHTASAKAKTSMTSKLTIGGVLGKFTSTTAP